MEREGRFRAFRRARTKRRAAPEMARRIPDGRAAQGEGKAGTEKSRFMAE